MTRPEADEVLTIQDVMEIAHIKEMTAIRWVNGKLKGAPPLPAVKVGRQWRILKRDLMAALATAPEASVPAR